MSKDEDMMSTQDSRHPVGAARFIAGRIAEIRSPNGPMLSPERKLPKTSQIAAAASARRVTTDSGRGQSARTSAILISARVPPTLSSNLGFADHESVTQCRVETEAGEPSGCWSLKMLPVFRLC